MRRFDDGRSCLCVALNRIVSLLDCYIVRKRVLGGGAGTQ